MPPSDRIEEAYAQDVGEDAARRQVKLAKLYFRCCGEHKESGHHEMCPNFVEAPPTVHADQGSLL